MTQFSSRVYGPMFSAGLHWWQLGDGQYWGQVKAGAFVIGHIRPGVYTATLYAGELAVGSPRSVTITAGGSSSAARTTLAISRTMR